MTAGMKPRSAMWSASSRTVISMSSSDAGTPVEQVDQAAGGGHHEVDAAAQPMSICRPIETPPYTVVTVTSTDAAQRLQHVRDLDGQFPGRDQDQGPRRLRPRPGPSGSTGRPAGSARAGRRPASCLSRSGPCPGRHGRRAHRAARGTGWRTAPSIPRAASAVTSGSGRPSAAKVVGSGCGAASAAASARSSSEGAAEAPEGCAPPGGRLASPARAGLVGAGPALAGLRSARG